MTEDAGRIWWRSRRGLLELDLLLVPFVEASWASLDPTEQEAYRHLIAHEDQDIWSWLQAGRAEGAPEFDTIVRLILDFNDSRRR